MATPLPEEDAVLLVHFKDAVGRKFPFPFDMVKTWQGMEELVQDAFRQVEVLGPQVMEGHYDLMDPDGEIILPKTWERLVRPGWAISMVMWPMDKLPPAGPPPVLRPVHPQTFGQGPTEHSRQPQPQDGFLPGNIPPSPGIFPIPSRHHQTHHETHQRTHHGGQVAPVHGAPVVINVAPTKLKHKPKPEVNHWGHFFAGKPSKKKAPSSTPSSTSDWTPRGYSRFEGGPFRSSHKARFPTYDYKKEYKMRPDPGSEAEIKRQGLQPNAHELGLIIVSRSEPQGHRVLRPPTFHSLEHNPTPADQQTFIAARLYEDEVSKGTMCLELTKSGTDTTSKLANRDAKEIRWINIIRNTLDLDEFENIALSRGDLAINNDVRLAMISIFKALREKKLGKSRNTWYIKTGTVIRGDVESGGKSKASAVFVSIPQLQADSFNRASIAQPRKGVCLPRRLHEMFHPYDTSLKRDKNQLFRSNEGEQTDEVLWIYETWVLIIDSVGILTYGNQRRQTYIGHNIEIRESLSQTQERTIRVTHPAKRQFQIPFDACQTFYKLQSAVRNQLVILERDDFVDDFELVMPDKEILTAKSWSRIVKNSDQSTVEMAVKWIKPDESEYDSDNVESEVINKEILLVHSVEADIDKQGGASKSSHGSAKRSRSVSRQRTTVSFAENDFFSIQAESSTTIEDTDLDIPALNPKVTPFLSWSILKVNKKDAKGDHEKERSSIARESIRVCLSRTETALRENPHSLVAELKGNFPALDVPSTGDEAIFKSLERRLAQIFKHDSNGSGGPKLRFSNDKTASHYKGFVSASIRALEAYTLKEVDSPVISSYYRALSNTLESPKPVPTSNHPERWVLSLEPIPIEGFKYLNTALYGLKCSDCNSQKIYDNLESAMDHLRKTHCAGSTVPTILVEYVIPLSAAKELRLADECSRVLRMSQDVMVQITRRLRDIQDGMVSKGQFQQPEQGIPFALLTSFELIVAFVCAVPLLLDEIYWFYKFQVDEHNLGSLVLDAKVQANYQRLEDFGRAAEALTKDAERVLVSSILSKRKEDVVKFFASVGPHCVAAQIICNLLRHPVRNNASAAELYQTYCTDYESEVLQHPSKRQIPGIGAMADELARLKTVTEWQQELVSSLRTVLSPDTYPDPIKETREGPFAVEEYILDKTGEELEMQWDMISSSLDDCEGLLGSVKERMEIMSDDQSRAIFVFTVVTVIFLPMSFIATYLSMNGGPSEKSWSETQALFWEISAPLAVGIGIFCLGIAWRGSEVGTVRDWIARYITRRRGRGESDSETDSNSDDTGSRIEDA